ncbi:hypothetical protein PGSY75_0003600C, partial [Plasmodium gaboni]
NNNNNNILSIPCYKKYKQIWCGDHYYEHFKIKINHFILNSKINMLYVRKKKNNNIIINNHHNNNLNVIKKKYTYIRLHNNNACSKKYIANSNNSFIILSKKKKKEYIYKKKSNEDTNNKDIKNIFYITKFFLNTFYNDMKIIKYEIYKKCYHKKLNCYNIHDEYNNMLLSCQNKYEVAKKDLNIRYNNMKNIKDNKKKKKEKKILFKSNKINCILSYTYNFIIYLNVDKISFYCHMYMFLNNYIDYYIKLYLQILKNEFLNKFFPIKRNQNQIKYSYSHKYIEDIITFLKRKKKFVFQKGYEKKIIQHNNDIITCGDMRYKEKKYNIHNNNINNNKNNDDINKSFKLSLFQRLCNLFLVEKIYININNIECMFTFICNLEHTNKNTEKIKKKEKRKTKKKYDKEILLLKIKRFKTIIMKEEFCKYNKLNIFNKNNINLVYLFKSKIYNINIYLRNIKQKKNDLLFFTNYLFFFCKFIIILNNMNKTHKFFF